MFKCFIRKAMAQRPITSFFKPNPNQSLKRKLTQSSNTTNTNEDQPLIKHQKTSEQKSIVNSVGDLSQVIRQQSILTPALSPNIGQTWFRALRPEFSKDYFKQLSRFLENERKSGTVYPSREEVFAWTLMTDISSTKVVILGQDPYHGAGQAHGLCFSVKKGIAAPPSLINIFKELETDIPGFKRPAHGDLTGWAKQGVLLLNACLTVRANAANSHSNKGWEQLTDSVIKWLNNNLSSVVFLLWGSYAQKKGQIIDKKKHKVLQSVHPSPLSAHRGFFRCQHFSSTNDYLESKGKAPIDWNQLP